MGDASALRVSGLVDPAVLTFDAPSGACVWWDGAAWVEDANVTAVEGNRTACASTHLSSFAVAALVAADAAPGGACRELGDGAALYATAAYRAWVLCLALVWAGVAAHALSTLAAVWRDHRERHPRSPAVAVAALAATTLPAVVSGSFACLGLLRFAFFSWAASVPRPRAACFELGGRRGPLALYALGAPFLLAALSAIALAWVQFVLGEGGKRRSGLEGDCLLAFAVWNGCYAVLAAASALALASLEAPDAARAVARVQLAYEAVVAAAQGAAYVGFGLRLLERLDRMTGAKADARVDQYRGRVRRLLLCAGAGSLAVAACAALSATLPPTPRMAFGVVAVAQRAVEALLAVAASAFGLRASAAGQSSLYFPRIAKRVTGFVGLRRRRRELSGGISALASFFRKASSAAEPSFFRRASSAAEPSFFRKASSAAEPRETASGRVELGHIYGGSPGVRDVVSPMARGSTAGPQDARADSDDIFTPMGRTAIGKRAAFAEPVAEPTPRPEEEEEPLPEGREATEDESGARYYANAARNLSQWERPACLDTPTARSQRDVV